MSGEVFFQQFLNALGLGIMYALIAVGFTLFFGVIEVVNFAHGEVFMMGAFVALIVSGILVAAGFTMGSLPLFVAVLVAVLIAGGIIGVLLEKFIVRPMRGAPDIMTLLITLGISIVMREAVMLLVPNGRNPH
ncbi:MAG: hypothetical protein WC127_02610, partial [Acidaminococcaceae bacterium]